MNRQLSKMFASVASLLSKWMGSPWALIVVALLVVIGLVVFGIDRTNIAISIATLLMVFILQNSQNRDAAALHVKLDEVITHLEGPRDDVAGIESKSHEEIEELHEELHEEVGATEDRPRQDA
jgi:low affinity Fe/Cu permease